MDRAMWSGEITFGLVNIPIKMMVAARDKSPKFNTLCRECLTRVRYIKKCDGCPHELVQSDLVKAYEYEHGKYVTIDEGELEQIGAPQAHTINIEDFVNLSEVDPLFFRNGYHLVPAGRSGRAYNLLRQALIETGKAAVGRFVMRSKSSLACIRPREGVLVLHSMHYGDEVVSARAVEVTGQEETLSPRELELAVELVKRLAIPFQPARYEDTYRKNVETLIDSKIAGQEVIVPATAPPAAAEVIDLMEALRRSMEAAQAERQRASGSGDWI